MLRTTIKPFNFLNRLLVYLVSCVVIFNVLVVAGYAEGYTGVNGLMSDNVQPGGTFKQSENNLQVKWDDKNQIPDYTRFKLRISIRLHTVIDFEGRDARLSI